MFKLCESLIVTKVAQKIKFEGDWGELEAKNISRKNHEENIWNKR